MKKREQKAASKTPKSKFEKPQESPESKRMKEIYNKIIIKVKELRPTPEQKQALIQECLALINNRYDDMTKKKDGSWILQAIIKHGNEEVREKVVD